MSHEHQLRFLVLQVTTNNVAVPFRDTAYFKENETLCIEQSFSAENDYLVNIVHRRVIVY